MRNTSRDETNRKRSVICDRMTTLLSLDREIDAAMPAGDSNDEAYEASGMLRVSNMIDRRLAAFTQELLQLDG